MRIPNPGGVLTRWKPALLRWSKPRRLLALGAAGAVACALLVAGSITWTRVAAAGRMHPEQSVPIRPVALVLGAGLQPDGSPSGFLSARLELARRLYETGKVRAVLVTGDNGQVQYNEVDPMRHWLVARGVPDRKVIGDYAGFDTYQSCVRARRIFGVRQAIVVTQSYHLPRAVALCNAVGVDSLGVGDDSARRWPDYWRNAAVRDGFACVKAAWEATWQPDPTYLGRYETSVDTALRDP